MQSWDTANKATELSDFSVCTTWGTKGKNLYLLGVLRKRLEYPALKRLVREQQSLFNAHVVLIEDKASGTQLIQELNVDGCHGVTSYKPECDKIMRLHAQTATIENGFVFVPEAAPWLAQYLHEMTVFPKGKHDDQVDSTAQFLDWFKKPMRGWAIFELYRMRAEELEGRRSSSSPSAGADLSRGDSADEDPDLAFAEENRRFARMTEGRRPTGNEVAEHEARLLVLVQKSKSQNIPSLASPASA